MKFLKESSGPCIAMYSLKVLHSCLGTPSDSSSNFRSSEKLVPGVHLYTLLPDSLVFNTLRDVKYKFRGQNFKY